MTKNESAKPIGLTTAEVDERIRQGLVNSNDVSATKTVKEIIVENLFSVFNIIIFLLVLFLLFWYVYNSDDRLLLDSIGVIFIAVLNTLIAIIQEIRAKRALDKVSLLLKKEVTVVRNGEESLIPQQEVVKDDVIIVRRGDQVVVDGSMVLTNGIEIDESLLTGESVPIAKQVHDQVLSGSFCVSGSGYYVAEKIGSESFAAGVTGMAKKYKFLVTPLQKKINRIVEFLFATAIILIIAEFFAATIPFSDSDFIRKISTILISLIPQGLVLMASVTFALGVYRISKLGAIIQRLNAIESFSNVQVVCTDKTGTLTQNKLAVHSLFVAGDEFSQSFVEKLLGTVYAVSSERNATLSTLSVYQGFSSGVQLIEEMPFSSDLKMSGVKVLIPEISSEPKTFILGGYDVLIDRVDPVVSERIQSQYRERIYEDYRTVLFGELSDPNGFEEVRKKPTGFRIKPIAVIAILDQIRDDVLEAIQLFNENGIRVAVLSGDAASSIRAVVREIGWDVKHEQIITGSELESLSDSDYENAARECIIFARLRPEHKLKLLQHFRKKKYYTAMLGDGVNDLPAIKEAEIGIAMEEGSSITKEVADIVLLKNKFALLPHIFSEGNRIVNTVNAVAKLFLTKNALVILIALLSMIFSLDFPLTPRRVSFINLFTIGLPAFIIALRNTQISPSKRFFTDLFSFVLVSSIFVTMAGYTAAWIAKVIFPEYYESFDMVSLTAMIFTALAGYLFVASLVDKERWNFHWYYAGGIVLLYLFVTIFSFENIIYTAIKIFYEIEFIPWLLWLIILPVSIVFALGLFWTNTMRHRLLFGKDAC